jgi:hypothetical protein
MACRTLCVLPVLGVIALSCTDAAGRWCSRAFDSGFRSWFSEGREAFWTIRFLAEKSVHVTMFTSLGAVLWVAFHDVKQRTVLALAAGCAIGCCSELFQRLFPTRDPSIRNVLINWSSVGAGVAISYCLDQIKEARSLTVKTVGHPACAENIGADLLALSLHICTQHGASDKISLQKAETPELVASTSA